MECERAEAAALHVDLASWQRCLEGLFIAWVNGFVLSGGAMKLSERRKWVVCAHPLKKVPVSNWKILTEKRTGPQSEEESSRRTLDCGAPHAHARQLREMLEHLDVACGVAVASTNGERGMRPRGREVE